MTVVKGLMRGARAILRESVPAAMARPVVHSGVRGSLRGPDSIANSAR